MVPWQDIDSVFLDMDGTLLDLHFDNFFWMQHLPRRYAQKHQISEEDSSLKLEKILSRDRGSLNWYSTDYWSEMLQIDVLELKHEVSHKVAIRPYCIDFLDALRAQVEGWIEVERDLWKSFRFLLHPDGDRAFASVHVDLAGRLKIDLDKYNFAVTDPFTPVETSRPGVYACGIFNEPKDIPTSVMEASAAASAANARILDILSCISIPDPVQIDEASRAVGPPRPRPARVHMCSKEIRRVGLSDRGCWRIGAEA